MAKFLPRESRGIDTKQDDSKPLEDINKPVRVKTTYGVASMTRSIFSVDPQTAMTGGFIKGDRRVTVGEHFSNPFIL